MHRVGSDHVERAGQSGVIQQINNAVDHVFEMDPRQVLAAVADRAAQPEAERRQHFSQRATLWRQHHAGAQQADAGCAALRLQRQRFPALAQLVGEFVAAAPLR